jgi:hypothetical protein
VRLSFIAAIFLKRVGKKFDLDINRTLSCSSFMFFDEVLFAGFAGLSEFLFEIGDIEKCLGVGKLSVLINVVIVSGVEKHAFF